MEAALEKKAVSFEKYEAYKDSGEDWLGKIPEHWKLLRGNYVFKVIEERSKAGDEELLTVSEHRGVKPRSESTVHMFMAESYKGYKVCHPGDLVINSLWAWSRGLGFSKYHGIISTAYSVYRPDTGSYDADYLNYLLRTDPYVGQYLIASKGIWISRLQLSDWAFLRIPILSPPKEEQTAIASFLDRKTEQIDKAIAIKEKQIELLKEHRQILIQNIVTGKKVWNHDKNAWTEPAEVKDSGVEWIGEVPEHWEVKRLKFIASEISIKVSSKDSELPYIGMENVESWTGAFVPSNSEVEGLANWFCSGDVLFGKLRPYLAKVYLAAAEGICSTEFLVYRGKKGFSSEFLRILMLSHSFIGIIHGSTYGAKMPRANSDFIGNRMVPVPPKAEQFKIVGHIGQLRRKTDETVSKLKEEIEKLKEYKTSLINAAVTGKIKVI